MRLSIIWMLAGTHQYQRFCVENEVERYRSKAPYQRPGMRTTPDSMRITVPVPTSVAMIVCL
jgi:hypothetical protein